MERKVGRKKRRAAVEDAHEGSSPPQKPDSPDLPPVVVRPPDSDTEVLRLTSELHIHQEELEIQNRQLVESQRLLEESRDRYASLYDFAPVAYVTLDTNGVIREINLTGATMLGQTRARLIDRPFILFVTEPYRRSFLGHLARCRNGERPLTSELVIRAGEDRHIPVEIRTGDGALDGPDGPPLLSVLIDISDRLRLDQERERLRVAAQSEQLLRTVLQTLPVGVRVVGAAGESLIVNEACRTVWGIAPGAPLPAWDFQKGWRAEDMQLLTREDWPVACALRGDQRNAIRQMIHVKGFDGPMRVVMQSAVPLSDDSGAITGAVEVTEDVTRLIAAQETARRRREQLEAAFDAAHLSFWDWELGNNRVVWSGPFERIFARAEGESKDDVRDFLRRVHPEDAETVRAAILSSRRNQTTFEQEFRVLPPEGGERWVLAKGRFVYRAGQPIRMGGVVTDITERKRAEAELRRAKEAAEEASRLKDDFLATVSHELRTPLSAIILWAHLARTTLKGEREKAEAIDTIQRSAKAQSQIVEDLLDISRAIAGKLRLNLQPASLASAVQAAMESVRPSAEAKQIRLKSEMPGDLPVARIDPDRIQQVAWNLLANAIKFTPAGGSVSARISAHGRRGARQFVRLTVSDTGPGIDPEFLPHIFDRFRQGESGTTRRHGGLGLGLAIARELVQMHGGTIRAESGGARQGATFTVELPLPADPVVASRPTGPEGDVESLRGIDVLLVEDELDTRGALGRVLVAAGAKVRATPSAHEALEAFRAARPDVVVSDISMPGEDGYQLLRQIRDIESGGRTGHVNSAGRRSRARRTPAVALTARARAEDRAEALAAGFQAHLAKPIEASQLISVVAHLAHPENPGE